MNKDLIPKLFVADAVPIKMEEHFAEIVVVDNLFMQNID